MVAQKIQILRKIWVFEPKNAQFTTFLLFVGPLKKQLLFFCPFCLRKTFEQKVLVAQKKNCANKMGKNQHKKFKNDPKKVKLW